MKKILVLDSTQISTYCQCPMMHHLEYEGCITNSNIVPDHIAFGAFGHKLLEIYYTRRGLGDSPNLALSHALAFDPPSDSLDYIHPDVSKKVKDRFMLYWGKWTPMDISPLSRSHHKIYFDNNGLPLDGTSSEPLVEKGFSYELLNTNEYLFVLEGRVDILGKMGSNTVWMDHKWQLRERKLYGGSIQFKNYSLAMDMDLGVINYIRLHQKISDTTFVRDIVSFNPMQRRLWKEELTEIYVKIAKEKFGGKPHWKNRDSCAGKFGYPCKFTPLCDEPLDSIRDLIRDRDFVTKIEWKPW